MTAYAKLSPMCQKIVAFIRARGSITALDAAMHLQTTRLAPRMKELEDDHGYPVVRVKEGRYVRYSLADTPVREPVAASEADMEAAGQLPLFAA